MNENEEIVLNSRELSLVLAISEPTVKKLAKNKELPCYYKNNRPFFSYNAIVKHFRQIEGGAV